MVMRQIIKLIFVLSLVIMTSCSTQQRVVYRNCDCNTKYFNILTNRFLLNAIDQFHNQINGHDNACIICNLIMEVLVM